MENTQIDIGEGGLILEVPGLLDILLKDMSTGKNCAKRILRKYTYMQPVL